MTKQKDSLGRRASDKRQSSGKQLRLTDQDRLWLQKLHQHGPLPTSYLLAYTQHLRASEKRQSERLGDLFHEETTKHGGAYIDRPPQQFATHKAGYNQLVHQVSKSGLKALKEVDLEHQANTHKGPWVHKHMVACITASIELATLARPDVSFIAQHDILDRAKASLTIPLKIAEPGSAQFRRKDLTPDGLFGLAYHTNDGDRFRFFVLEADRSTEPVTSSNWNRKSFQRHLAQYEALITEGAYRDHFKLTAPLLVLNVVPDQARIDLMLRATERQVGDCAYQLFQCFEAFAPPWKPPEPNFNLLNAEWLRSECDPFRIDLV
ncbi:MAG: hypothetical protein AAF429_15520 [Pseudomonadota bacterium]